MQKKTADYGSHPIFLNHDLGYELGNMLVKLKNSPDLAKALGIGIDSIEDILHEMNFDFISESESGAEELAPK